MPPDPSWPTWAAPLIELKGLWVAIPLLLLIAFLYWAERRWPSDDTASELFHFSTFRSVITPHPHRVS